MCYCLYVHARVSMSADVFACTGMCAVMYVHKSCACGVLVSERGSHLDGVYPWPAVVDWDTPTL